MLTHVFAPPLYRFDVTVPSYWQATASAPDFPELEGDRRCDVAVIGGGYTGLSAALTLAEAGISVAVLEAGPIGWGASGRNGGFVCFPSSKLGPAAMVRRFGLEETRAFYRTQAEGIELVRDLIHRHDIEADFIDEANYVVAHHPRLYAELAEEAAFYRTALGLRAEMIPAPLFRDSVHGGTEAFGAMRYWPSAALHPLKFVAGLAGAAARAGAQILARSPVESWVKSGSDHVLVTAKGAVTAGRVIVATNGFTPDGLHPAFDRRVMPALSNIIVTRPLTLEELERHQFRSHAALSNARSLLYYYRRLPDNRILLGGRGDTSGTDADGARIRADLIDGLFRCFPEWRGIDIDYFWRGCVATTADLVPMIGRLEEDPSISYGLAYHGNGVANAPWAGRALARAIIEGGPVKVSAVQAGLARRLPQGMGLRRLLLAAAYLWYGHKDRRAEGRWF